MLSPPPLSPSRFLTIGAAALLLHIGTAAAAQPPGIRERMRAVLTGSIALDGARRADARRHVGAGSETDSQAFARRLLLGWSATAVHGLPARTMSGVNSNAGAQEDMETRIRRQLLGEAD